MSDVMPLPYDIQAEEAVLGSILIDNDAFTDILDILKEEDFYREDNKAVWRAYESLWERQQNIDFVTVEATLTKAGKLDALSGGASYIIGLLNVVPTSINVREYATIVADTAQQRRLLEAGKIISGLAYAEGSTDDALNEAEKVLFGVRNKRSHDRGEPIKGVVSEYIDTVEEAARGDGVVGLHTGFTDLDNLLKGLMPNDLILIAARPSMGKTALQIAISQHLAHKERKSVAIFSLEMSKPQLVHRMIAATTRLDTDKLKTGRLVDDEWTRFYSAAGELADTKIFIDDTAGLTPMQLRGKVRRLAARNQVDAVFVDYIQLMEAGRTFNNRNGEIEYISRSLKNMAREFEIPVIVAAQLNRATESAKDKRPELSHLRDSGSLEQDADIVAFIYRDDYYYGDESTEPNVAEIIVKKNRNGPTGTAKLFWQAQLATFRNLQRDTIYLNGNQPSAQQAAKKYEV